MGPRLSGPDNAASVVVTGLGVVAGTICGAERLRESLRRSVMSCSDVDRRAGYHAPESARLAVLSGDVNLSPWLSPAAARRMSAPSRFAVAAAHMALADAAQPEAYSARTAVVMSNALGAVHYTEQLLRTAMLDSPGAVSPFTFTESVSNAAAAQVAIACQARGTNLTIVQREAGILTAVARGAAEVAAGRTDCALVGGVEEMPPIMHALFDRLEALARPGHDGGEVARPFDRRRSGFVAAEGAVVLVLEREQAARSRNATIRARIRGFGGAFDPSAPRIGWGRGAPVLATRLGALLDRCGLATRHIGRIVSGASGAVAGDRLEGQTLLETWQGHPLPPVLAPKGVTGQYGGGFLASAVLSVADREFGATGGFSEPDPAVGVIPHVGGPLPHADITLVTSLASGGAAAWLLLEHV